MALNSQPRRGMALVLLAVALPLGALAQSVTSFTVVNSDSDTDIVTLQTSGSVSVAGTPRINLRANTSNTAKVVFSGNAGSRTENAAPFALKGDSAGNYNAWSPAAGTYTITATPYTSAGVVGQPATLTLTIETQAVAQPAVANFTIVDADSGTDIATVGTSSTVSSATYPRINVRANVNGQTRSVVFQDGSGAALTDATPPFSFKGDSNGVYSPWSPAAGVYTIEATPYAAAGGAGPLARLTLTVTGHPPTTAKGRLMIDPDNPHYFVYDRDRNGDGQRDPAYLAGVGGPEGFLYLSSGRKQTIVNRLTGSASLATPVNGIYFHATRAFGGDGGSTETPFVNNADPRSGIDAAKMADWRSYLQQLDDAGIVLWFNLLDDHALPYGCDYNADYGSYAQSIVDRFKDLLHLVWVTQEEYRWGPCSKAQNDARQTGLAAAIRAADPDHPVATHHMGGQAMQFGSDANIRVFGQQTNNSSPEQMHDSAGRQGWTNSSWVYVMAEAHPWHRDLIDAELANGSGRTPMRRSNWATALAGGSVMMYDSFESSDPTEAMLDDLRRLRQFMESTPFNRMTPLFDTALANKKLDGTKYILANDAAGQYILYADAAATRLGVRGAPAGSYELTWYDPVTGARQSHAGAVGPDGQGSFVKPGGMGNEVAVFVRKQ